MEDVDNEVLVCLGDQQTTDEGPRLPRPARPGASGVYHEYERNGVNLFLFMGWRQVEVTDRPPKVSGWSGSWWTRTTRTDRSYW